MDNQSLTPQKPKRIWRIVLVLSLALNLAVAGVVIGSFASGRAGDGGPRSFDLGIGPLARALAPDERRQITRSLRENRALRDLNPRGQMGQVVDAIAADPFDPDALQSLMAAQSQKVDAMQAQAQAAFLEAITNMTAERRAAFAVQLREELWRPRGPRRQGQDN